MQTAQKLHFWRGKLRGVLSWIFVALMIVFIHRFPELDGLILMVVGAGLRMWASGYLEKEGRLSVSGPYRFVRNPLYVGTILIGVGMVVSQDAWVLLAVLGALCAFVFYPLVLAEESVLQEKFKENFLIYRKFIPRFIPRVIPSREIRSLVDSDRLHSGTFSWNTFRENRGLEPAWTVLGIVLFMTVVWQMKR